MNHSESLLYFYSLITNGVLMNKYIVVKFDVGIALVACCTVLHGKSFN